jgi:AraC-like DNA-binding protein
MTQPAQIHAADGMDVSIAGERASWESGREWESTITETFCRMNAIVREYQGVFSGQLRTRDYGNLQFSTVIAGPHHTIRTPEMIDSEEDFFISLVTQGQGEIRQGDNRALLSNGAFTVVDGSRPFSFSFPADFEQIIIRVPRPDFLAHIPERRLDNVLAMPLPGHVGPSSLVSAVFRQAAQLTESVGEAVGEAMVLPMLDMFAVSLQSLADTSSETQMAHQRDLKRAQKNLLAHLHDPEWTLKKTSLELGMSQRYLHQVFAGVGLTPASWWMQARLEHALRLLQSPGVTVREAAERTGFKDPAHFSRAFKKQHGITPGKIRDHAPLAAHLSS